MKLAPVQVFSCKHPPRVFSTSATTHCKSPQCRWEQYTLGAFLMDDLDHDQWSKITPIIMYQKELMKLLWGRIHRFILMQPNLSEHRSSQWNAPLHWGTKYMWFNKKEILAFALTTSKKNEWQNDDFLHLRTKWNSYFWCTKINKKQTIGYSRKIHTFMTEGMLENLRGGGVNGSGNPEGRGALNLKIHPWG